MNILNEKKEVTPIITPSLGYKLRSINWNEDFYFDNPIDKEKINSIPKAIEISKDIFLAIEKSGMQYRETYKWDEYLYFKMTAEIFLQQPYTITANTILKNIVILLTS